MSTHSKEPFGLFLSSSDPVIPVAAQLIKKLEQLKNTPNNPLNQGERIYFSGRSKSKRVVVCFSLHERPVLARPG